MSKFMKMVMVVMFAGTMFTVGCEKKDETAGQKLDKAVDATKDAAKTAADKTADAAKTAADKVKDATK